MVAQFHLHWHYENNIDATLLSMYLIRLQMYSQQTSHTSKKFSHKTDASCHIYTQQNILVVELRNSNMKLFFLIIK